MKTSQELVLLTGNGAPVMGMLAAFEAAVRPEHPRARTCCRPFDETI